MKTLETIEHANSKNSDGSGWLQGSGRVERKGIRRNGMSRAKISISVITVQTGVWFCYKCSRLVSGSAISVVDRCLVLI